MRNVCRASPMGFQPGAHAIHVLADRSPRPPRPSFALRGAASPSPGRSRKTDSEALSGGRGAPRSTRVPMYYLDIETTGVDPRRAEVVTIQYQPVAPGGRPGGPLTILKSWESSEREILSRFVRETDFFDASNPWAFFPTGFNLDFEYRFLLARLQRKRIDPGVPWDWAYTKPDLDLHPVAILMNGGRYKGSSLEAFSRKPTSGHSVITALQTRDWPAVERYIELETNAFFELLTVLHRLMPDVWRDKVRPLVQGP